MGRGIGRMCAMLVVVFLLATVCAQAESPQAYVPENRHEFEPVVEGVAVYHDFVVRNQGTTDLLIERVRAG